jgi:small subunit ribosomal protein S13
MARIIGVEVPPNKRIDIALRYIYGIGPSNAKVILANAKIDPGVRAKDLTEQQLSQIVHAIQDGIIEGDCAARFANLGRCRASAPCGIRHLRGLPVRGQRTHPTRAIVRPADCRVVAVQLPRPASTGSATTLSHQLY